MNYSQRIRTFPFPLSWFWRQYFLKEYWCQNILASLSCSFPDLKDKCLGWSLNPPGLEEIEYNHAQFSFSYLASQLRSAKENNIKSFGGIVSHIRLVNHNKVNEICMLRFLYGSTAILRLSFIGSGSSRRLFQSSCKACTSGFGLLTGFKGSDHKLLFPNRHR